MKSFFKKLAFVMALAMVVSLAAPAARYALAATEFTYAEQETGAKVTVLNLKAGDEVDLKFKGVKNYADFDLKWVSADEEVATVDQSGVVTAVAEGTTTVELQVGDGTVYTSQKVVVNVADSFTVDLGTAKSEISKKFDVTMGEEIDLNYYGVKDWSAGRFTCTWVSYDEEVATVDENGVVTPVSEGAAVVKLVVTDNVVDTVYEGVVAVIVKEAVAPTEEPTPEPTATPTPEPTATPTPEPTPTPIVDKFAVEQTTDTQIKVTFVNKELTKSDLDAGLVFYYYVGDVKRTYPIQVKEVKDGVATLSSYVTFVDGTKYGVEYDGESHDFTAYIGEVASIVVTWKCNGDDMVAYAGETTTITAKLLNAQGIDITNSSVNKVDKYIKYTLVEEPSEGEFYIPDEMEGKISFDSERVGAVAKVKVEYVTGKFDDNYNAIPGPSEQVIIVCSKAPAYGIDASKLPVATIVTPDDKGNYSTDFSKSNTIIALNDENGKMSGARLAARFIDTKGEKVNTLANPGSFVFESTNVAILYIDEYGYLMTNSTGKVNVIIYYTPDANTKTLVGVTSVDVREKRSVSSMSIYNTSAIISTEAPYNTADFTITLKDKLTANIAPENISDIKVECLTKKPTGADDTPVVSPVSGSNGEYTFTIKGDAENLPIVNGKQAATYSYNFKVSCGSVSKQFTVRINKPDGKVQGVEVAISGGTDLKTENDAAKALNVTVYKISNGVRYDVIEVAPKVDKSKAVAGNYYYTITRDGKDITGTATGTSINIGLTEIKATNEFTTGTASGTSLNVVKKNPTGTYTVTVYQATGEAGKTATGFTSKKSASVVVTDSQPTMTYVGKVDNFYILDGSEGTVEDLVKKCFSFKLGGNDIDYSKVEYVVNANIPGGTLSAGSVCYVNSVDFYVLVGDSTYVKYTVAVKNYVEIKSN